MNCEGTTIKNKNYNTRRFPKGIKEIPYPAEDIIQRFISKDYVGEIRLNNETGLFEFNPALEDATASYACKEGNDFELLDVLYHNGSEFLKATASSADTLGLWIVIEIVTENIFRIAQAGKHEVKEHGLEVGEYYFTGVSTVDPGKLVKDEPNLYSNPMVFVDSADSISVLSFRPNLQPDGNGDHLPNSWNYTDLSDTDVDYIGKAGMSPVVTDAEDGLELKYIDSTPQDSITYITCSNYSPSEDIPPAGDEVEINGVIWKEANSDWTDSGSDILAPNGDDANVATYGRFYNIDSIVRLLAANPGWRLPTYQDLENTFSLETLKNETSNLKKYTSGTVSDNDPAFWGNISSNNWTNSTGFSMVPAGSKNSANYNSFNDSGFLWRTYIDSNGDTQLKYDGFYATDALGPEADIYKDGIIPNYAVTDPERYASVRLVKDI